MSLNQRLLISASIILTIFFGFTAISLNNAFNASYNIAQQKHLKNYVYMLLTAAKFNENGTITMPTLLADTAFNTPNSGLYAHILSPIGIVWQSKSMLGRHINLPRMIDGKEQYRTLLQGEESFLDLAYRIIWENDAGQEYQFTLHVSQERSASVSEQNEFKHTLWYWLGGTGLALLLIQAFILRLSLKPLRDVSQELTRIQSGHSHRLSQDYPYELTELTRNLNRLLDQEQSRRQRYKNALADLAHSLKTPLAVLQNELDRGNLQHKRQSDIQVEQIIKLIDYQLQRAATEGSNSLQAPIRLKQLIDKIISTLQKVYQEKYIDYYDQIDGSITLHADEGDMYELLGNLHENAFKYCHHQVSTTVTRDDAWVTIRIDNDGPPIPLAEQAHILERGKRLDTQTEGQGLGLAIANNIVDAYQGEMRIGHSALQGACFVIKLPNR